MFISDNHLRALSEGQLAYKTLKLIVQSDQFAPILNPRIFRRASIFLKELSNDNHYTQCLYSEELTTFIGAFVINKENIDFYWSVVEFWLNVSLESKNFTSKTV